MEEELLTLPLEGISDDSIIKVIGVGGGGCNAVNYMHRQGLKDVSFLVCNTDRQVLIKSSVPSKLQLGPGLGAGGDPDTARQYAEESREHIREALNDGTHPFMLGIITSEMIRSGTSERACFSPIYPSAASIMSYFSFRMLRR